MVQEQAEGFFYVKVFNPFSKSYANTPLAQCHRCLEQDKRRSYKHKVREVEHGCFSPLVFSTSGSLGPTVTVVYKRIASLIAEKKEQPYSLTLFWLCCRLSFSLLRSAYEAHDPLTIDHQQQIFLRVQLTSCAHPKY